MHIKVMKKGLILMTLFLFILLNVVKAEIRVTNSIQDIYNINEKISLQTTISYKDEISGYVKSSITCNAKAFDYYINPFNFKNSPQLLNIPELTLTKSMLGKCALNIYLIDLNNNLLDQSLIKVIDVSGKLNLDASLVKSELDPGNSLTVSGNIKNIRNIELKNSLLTITLDDKTYDFNLVTPDFKKEILLDSKIKSGNHVVKVNVKDNSENSAETSLELNIIPKPVDLKNLMNKLEFLPGDNLEVSSLLYDQANDLITNNAQIKLYDAKDNYITQAYSKLIYVIPQDALPGTWTIRTSEAGYNIESKFSVKELRQADFYIEGGVLYIRNLGNINYKDDLKINIDGKELIRNIDVKPKDISKIDLAKTVDPGNYDIDLKTSDSSKKFTQVPVPKSNDLLYLTGTTIKDTSNTVINKPYILAGLLAVIIITLYITNRNKNYKKISREKEIQQGYMSFQKIKKDKEASGFKPKKFQDMSNEELSDYRKQILKNMKENKDDENEGYQYKRPKDEGKGGLFSMFG